MNRFDEGMRQLDEQLAHHQRNRDDFDLARQVERETVEAAAQICKEVCLETGAMPGSTIHTLLVDVANRIRKIAK